MGPFWRAPASASPKRESLSTSQMLIPPTDLGEDHERINSPFILLPLFQIISWFDFFDTSILVCIQINNMFRYIVKLMNQKIQSEL
jgi:hypothetical protein